jgi:hypothetical protein
VSQDLDRAEQVAVAGEREMLDGFLDFYREELIRKVRGLSEPDARRKLVPSATTLAGLVRHMTAVERNWFERRLAQRPESEIPPNSRGDDSSWSVGDQTIESLISEYEAACARSREIGAGYDLDHVVPHPRLGRVSCRWIYLHMIEETARHAGHADILREQTDGATG